MFTDPGTWNVYGPRFVERFTNPGSWNNGQLRTWATTGVVGGVWTIAQLCSWVVSVAEIDKRRAALGGQG
jgi:hypothetical protein